MRFNNFEVTSSIRLQSGGLFWDMHNHADFRGLELIPPDNAAIMRWSVPDVSNPWGCYDNHSRGLELHFKNLLFLHIGPRDEEIPMTEDICVAAVLMVDPTVHGEPYLRQVTAFNAPFRLLFLFQSAREIEIDSEVVELVPVKGE